METTVCVYAGSSCPLPVYTRSYPNRAFIILTWYREEETYPDSVTTGAWSSEFSFRISVVFWQDTECVTVRGADRCRLWTVRFHHLQDRKMKVLTPTCPVIPPLSYSWFGVFCYCCCFLPGFWVHLSVQAEEAFLTHPLIPQELWPAGKNRWVWRSALKFGQTST